MSEEKPAAEKKDLGVLDRFLNLFSDVRRGEGATALVLLASIFMLLVAYYVLKTVREPLVLVSAVDDLQVVRGWGLPEWLSEIIVSEDTNGPQIKAVAAACQAILLLGYVPLYSWIASKVTRVKLLVGVTLFFVGCIELFFFLRLMHVPLLGFLFYIWLGIFSVSMIAQFWSLGNDLYSKDAGERLFPIIGVGATAGSPVGSKVAGFLYDYLAPEANDDGTYEGLDGLQRWIVDSELDPSFILMQLSAALLVVFLGLLLWAVARFNAGKGGAGSEGSAEDADDDEEDAADDARIGEQSGWALVFKSPYIRLIAAVILILNLVNTTGEFILSDLVLDEAARVVGEAGDRGAWVGAFYGDFFFYVNIIALLLQSFVVSRIIKYIGLKGVLFALPIVALGSYALFSLGLSLAVLRWAKTAENATDYSIMNTGKAMVWLPTSRAAKYKAKQTVDTLLVRFGDVVSAGLFLVGTVALHLGMPHMAMINVGLVIVWLFLTFLLVKKHQQVEEDPREDPLATGADVASSPPS